MLSPRKPRRCHALRSRGKLTQVYRAVREKVRDTLPGTLDVAALDATADQALEWLDTACCRANAQRRHALRVESAYLESCWPRESAPVSIGEQS